MTSRSQARVYRGTPRNLALLARKLQQGELVAVPTETVYGLAGNALDPRACQKIFRAKGRPTTDPLIVHIHHLAQLSELADVTPEALQLARTCWPGPLTMVLRKRAVVPDIVTSALDSVAVRMPAHPLFRRLLKRCGLPLAAPSANPFGYISPTTAAHVHAGLKDRIGYILDGGPADIGLESTIVDVRTSRKIQVLRPGAITAAQLEQILGRPVSMAKKSGRPRQAQRAPGRLTRHYSPRAKVVLLPRITSITGTEGTAWLFFQKPSRIQPHVYWLDARGDQPRAARQLFSRLRELDARGYTTIVTEMAPDGTYAEAINDRLRRAAAEG